ncbi:MAG: type II secretion system F family protein [Kiritimatiellales bacterium]|nr:type II secretion system F family protein [Kiritimatiellales bacterium]
MPHFKYIGRSKDGERVEGVVEAADRAGALRQIEGTGHVPVSIAETTKTVSQASGSKKRLRFELGFHRKPRMRMRDLLLFSRELSDLVASGMTLGRALHTLSSRKDESAAGKIILALRDEIIQGTSLSDALTLYPETFSTLYINLVRAGEASGHLPLSLENICVHYERVQEAREKVIAAMIYPAIVLGVGILSVIVLMIFVVPRFTLIFEEMGATLPRPTLVLMHISNFMTRYGIVVLVLIVFLSIVIRRTVSKGPGKIWWHRAQLHIPIFRGVITSNAYAHFSRTLGTLVINGASILPALGIVQKTISNVIIADEVGQARERVTDGSSISGPLAAGKVFPNLLTDMLAVGEETGDLAGSLKHITRRYDNQLDRMVKTCTTVLEPLLIVAVAVVIGAIAMCLLLPVLTLTNSLQV